MATYNKNKGFIYGLSKVLEDRKKTYFYNLQRIFCNISRVIYLGQSRCRMLLEIPHLLSVQLSYRNYDTESILKAALLNDLNLLNLLN